PFCVLDELDAPLDESNINRFIRVLQRFIEHSQFIIITHNKRHDAQAQETKFCHTNLPGNNWKLPL
ncbi:MAG: hypothetical protein HYZ37_04335, partial [Candidatus Solibacter usitatus]|nr:hypothetical protein [Candidatus Solibacter usitatus]